MPPRRRPLSIPTTAALPHSLKLPSTSSRAIKSLSRLSRETLLNLALEWLEDKNQPLCAPYLIQAEEGDNADDGLYPAAASLDELREMYEELRLKKGVKREVVDRILEGDWRKGITLYQLAQVDMQYLADHPTSLRWTAMKLVKSNLPLGEKKDDNGQSALPRFHAPTFLRNLQREISPVVKAHHHLRPSNPSSTSPINALPILRLSLHSTPYAHPSSISSLSSTAAIPLPQRIIYLAFPPSTPTILISLPPTILSSPTTSSTIAKLLLSSIPKAFSRPQHRFKLEPTHFSSRSIPTLLAARGSGKACGAQGGWGIFADGSVEDSPLTSVARKRKTLTDEDDKENQHTTPEAPAKKRRKALAASRFGNSGQAADGKPIERFAAVIEDPFPAGDGDEAFAPRVRLLFHGTHVFAGIRKLVEEGVVDGVKMPGWMTGEAGVTGGTVNDGKMGGWDAF